jgi:hypothetical protein
MSKIIDTITEQYQDDPIVFAWLRAMDKSDWSDEKAVFNLVRSLISHKNVYLKVIDGLKQKSKVIPLRKAVENE